MESIENIILRHSKRGMLKLKEHMDESYCELAAREIMSWEPGVIFLTTGFYVAGYPETDGPAGTVVLAKALKKLGWEPVIVTDSAYAVLFTIRNIAVVPVDVDFTRDDFRNIITRYRPVGMISVERCGINVRDDYENMRGESIREHNSPIDLLFELAPEYSIRTVAVGDGGNEIGMGAIEDHIRKYIPYAELGGCKAGTGYGILADTKADNLLTATVSDWGCNAIMAAAAFILGNTDLFHAPEIQSQVMDAAAEAGMLDMYGEARPYIDGIGKNIVLPMVSLMKALIEYPPTVEDKTALWFDKTISKGFYK